METGLKNKHAFVTGASGGIGLELSKLYLDEGAKITATYNRNPEELNTLLENHQDHLNIQQLDLRNESSVRTAFENGIKVLGRIDILVANAAIATHHGVSVNEMSLEQWENTISVNLTGSFLCAKYFFKNLKDVPGEDAALVLIGSTAGFFGEAWYADYATSKAGLHGLLMSLKNEIVHLAPKGRVNLVNPGWTYTPMAEEALKDKSMMKRILQTIPMRKVATTRDIANAIMYLSSHKLSGHVSGQTLTIAGGMEGRVLFTPEETGVS
ncbi:MAG: SDR family NAD(P)-dependent oxidoreductase [Candidatus Thorarchaeota archaeon]